MTLIKSYENVEKHSRRDLEILVGKKFDITSFSFLINPEEDMISVSFDDYSNNLKLKRYFNLELDETRYNEVRFGETIAIKLIVEFTKFKTIYQIFLTGEMKNIIILGVK